MIARFIYNLLAPLYFIFVIPFYFLKILKRGDVNNYLKQRMGIYSDDLKLDINEKRCVWIHAVSVGEMYVAMNFLNRVREHYNDVRYIISSTTPTAYKILSLNKKDNDISIYFPFDFYWIIKKVIKTINPIEVILVESECWPNLIWQLSKNNIPISLINGRVSKETFDRYIKFLWFSKSIFSCLDKCIMQQSIDAERLVLLGANPNKVVVSGNLKFDYSHDLADRKLLDLFGRVKKNNQKIILASSTWPGEEVILAKVWKKLKTQFPSLILILAPRHIERSPVIIKELKNIGCEVVLRSNHIANDHSDLWLLDSTGELQSLYNDADIVFIGKSLYEKGGQSPIEAASRGCVLITGPNMNNFQMEAYLADEYNARIIIHDEKTLEVELINLLRNHEYLMNKSLAAKKMYEAGRGGINKTLEALYGI